MGLVLPQTVTGDTHAADLGGAAGTDTHASASTLDGSQEAITVRDGDYLNTANSTGLLSATGSEIKIAETTGITPSQTENVVIASAYYQIENRSTAQTFTIRIRQGVTQGAGTIIATETTASVAQNASISGSLSGSLTDQSGSQTCHISVQGSIVGTAVGECYISEFVVSGSLTGSAGTDTHAASLSGASGTCQ